METDALLGPRGEAGDAERRPGRRKTAGRRAMAEEGEAGEEWRSDRQQGTEQAPRPEAHGGGRYVELPVWWAIAWPDGLTSLCRVAMLATDVAVLGHYSTDALAASSLAAIWMSATGVLRLGFIDALRTLGSQSLGAGKPTNVGVWLQTGLFLTTVASVPTAALWLLTRQVMAVIGVEAHIAELAQTFATWSALWLWPRAVLDLFRGYLDCQGIVHPQLVCSLVFVGVNFFFNWFFVHGLFGWSGLGFRGSPIATALSQSLLCVTLLAYSVGWRKLHLRTWPGFTTAAISWWRVREYGKLAAPMSLALMFEEYQFQAVSVMAARLGRDQIATHNGMANVLLTVEAATFGISKATEVRTAFHLGNGDIPSAKRVLKIALAFAVASGVPIGLIFILGRNYCGRLYSSDPEIWKLTAGISWVVGIAYMLLSVMTAGVGVVQGQGRNVPLAVSFAVGGWLVGIPSAYLLGFVAKRGVQGLWLGMGLGYTVVMVLVCLTVWLGSWETAMETAVGRANKASADHSHAGEDEGGGRRRGSAHGEQDGPLDGTGDVSVQA